MEPSDEAPERVIARIYARISIDPETECWVWPGAKSSGYGRIAWSLGQRQMVYRQVHRVMYTATVGPIPEGLDLDHLCRVRACCNPAHLEPVTRQTNLLRGEGKTASRAAITHCPQGHKYTPDNTLTSKKNQRQCKKCTYERNRAYYWKNKEKRRAYNRQWRTNRSRSRASSA